MATKRNINELRIKVVEGRMSIQVVKTDGAIGGAGVLQADRELSPKATDAFIANMREGEYTGPREGGRALKFVIEFLSGCFDENGRKIA